MSRFCYAIRYDPHAILGHLKEAARYLKTILSYSSADDQRALPEQGHERRMSGQDAHEAVMSRRDNGVRRTVENGLLGGNDDDVHQALAIFLA